MHPILLNTNISAATAFSNPIVYSYAWTPYYGWYGQGETYGSQNGLTYLFPIIRDQSGIWGPSRSQLAAGIFPTTFNQSIAEGSWPGVGFDKSTLPYDMDWNTGPLSTATGYIGFTFGNVGHIGLSGVNEIVSMSRWIPQANRIYDNSRHYRGLNGGLCGYNRGIGFELIYNIPSNSAWGNSSTEKPLRTPWLKRKFNFIRKELQNIMQVMGNTGFYFNGMEGDDEYYIFWDFRNIGPSVTFGTAFMYPNNSATGNCWYASYTGICAAPDYLITKGITSFRSYLLTHGFTTNSNSSKFVDGLTALGSAGRADNIAASGSRDQSLGAEYAAALTDWTSMNWVDYVEDFKRYNGLCADNSFIGNYGYYRNNVGIQGYTNSSIDNYFTGLLNQNSSDYVPYPDTIPAFSSVDRNKTRYYGYNYLTTNQSPGYVQREVSNNFDSIYTYGGIMNSLKVEAYSTRSIDRQKLFYGNSYSYGLSFGIYSNYNWQISQVIGLNSEAPVWWLPANYLNSNAPGQTFKADTCYEIFGLSASQKYDPTGVLGSTRGSVNRCGDNKAPQWNSWHLNPVWGITAINATSNYGPANYIPSKGPYGLNGMSMGQVSRQTIGSGLTWTGEMFDSSGFPYPGNTLPAGTLYKQYWSHWYPMAFMALNYDVNWGRQVAVGNVYRALKQKEGTYPLISGSNWNGVQRPINVWIQDEKLYLEGDYSSVADNDLAQNLNLGGAYFEPTGLVQGYHVSSTKTLVTQYVAEAGVMYYENIRHQYLNKAGRYTHWNPYNYSCVTSATGGQVMVSNKSLPQLVDGLTMYGVCGAITMRLGRKLNTVIGDCNIRGNGMVYQTVYLAPGNDSERSYLMSGAQKVDGKYLWRITFAHPATDPSPLIIRGACSGVTTAYYISGVTDYINNPNNKFGVWWNSGNYEIPIVENPPIPEALRRGIVNLPNNPEIMYNAITTNESRNNIPVGYENPDLFGLLNVAPYNLYKDGLTWGSQNGLTYMWPVIFFGMMGVVGPSRSNLDAGIYPLATGAGYATDESWAAVGTDKYGTSDLNNSVAPWTTATGYIGLTFGATNFFDKRTAYEAVRLYSWIPNKYRTFFPSRSWRAILGVYTKGIQDTEIVNLKTTGTTYYTPWLKRKVEFAKAELNAFYTILGSCGFTMAHWEMDDEYYNWYDLRGIGGNVGDTGFYQKYLYPNNSSTSSKWYSSFTGICAAPDYYVTRGITSMRSFLLTRGWTTNPSSWKYVDGMTAMNNAAIPGNIVASGSPDIWLSQEYTSAMKDWTAGMMNDLADHFKTSNGIVADNSLTGNYGYYKTNYGTKGYNVPSYNNPSNRPYLTGQINWSSNDYVPYPLNASTSTYDRPMANYYSFNDMWPSLSSNQSVYGVRVGDIDNIHTYAGIGGQIDMTSNSPVVVDRNLDYRGSSYQFANNGNTFGKNNIATWQMRYRFSVLGSPTNSSTKKWLPDNYLNSGIAGQVIDFYGCAETVGSCGFKDFDPTGASLSTMCNPAKCGTDRAPLWMSWHLNPVWGINKNNLVAGATFGPANYIPIKGLEILNGRTAGSKTLELLRGSTTGIPTWSVDHFDQCGNPWPANTLPAGTIYNHYWTHWYPMAFMALLADVKWGRHIATGNVTWAKFQKSDPINYPSIAQSKWNGIQKPINTWVAIETWNNDYAAEDGPDLSKNITYGNYYYVSKGVTFGYYLRSTTALGVNFEYGEAGPMHFENIRHQYLNKTGRFTYWNPITYYNGTSSVGAQTPCENQMFPRRYAPNQTFNPPLANGLTFYGCCGAISYNQAKRLNSIIGECHTLGNGIVWETVYLAPVNMDERSYLISGAQKVDGNYLWRITFAHPATQSPIIVRGSVSGITTGYNVSGITNYIYEPNSKFGVWWTTDRYEIPIVENPPVSEAERLGVLNLPENPAFEYDPLTMTEANTRPKINAFAWQWPYEWVWSGNEWSRSDNSKNLISFSQDMNLNTIPGT